MPAHIPARMPHKGGNSFYRDKNDYTKFCVTLCGAPITDKDVDWKTAGTKKFNTAVEEMHLCAECFLRREIR